MTNYEVMIVIDNALTDEEREATLERIRGIIAAEGEVGETDVWGVRKLAYPINKKTEGYYVVIPFSAGPDFPKELDRRLRISDSVIRHMIVNKDAK